MKEVYAETFQQLGEGFEWMDFDSVEVNGLTGLKMNYKADRSRCQCGILSDHIEQGRHLVHTLCHRFQRRRRRETGPDRQHRLLQSPLIGSRNQPHGCAAGFLSPFRTAAAGSPTPQIRSAYQKRDEYDVFIPLLTAAASGAGSSREEAP